ncbi:MAG: UvrD-helicase domain-containing protein, partial [Sulfuricaulis sp.]|nr:UvrD-helicase domain-containing protein [Sulfuricaulis sp.]
MLDIALATSPLNNVVVHAAAGTGKTWLLTSRIIRLLLEGSEPGAILAITFTRKAASEIHERVTERLLALAGCDEETLPRLLTEIGAKTDSANREAARHLYEKHLSALHGLRTTTFHAFCQEILRRFPLEAEVPPGFELLETTAELEETAWLALDRMAFREQEGRLPAALDLLLKACGGVPGTRAVLNEFLAHRSDWWAYSENEPDPAAFAAAQLRELLDLTNDADPHADFFRDPDIRKQMARYNELLTGHATATNLKYTELLSRVMSEQEPPASYFERIKEVFIKSDGEPREIKSTRVLEQKLGATGTAELMALHRHLLAKLLSALSTYKRQWTFRVSHAWHISGMALLEEYQRLKLERGLLDFADMEWKTYRLLNRSRHAEWVQYKLDQRIDHLLVDEFQDTNPTQWRLLLPLLQEMVAGDPERHRSVFLVGDEKQSVYRFRRADPRLFQTAHHWLQQHAQAQTLSQHLSRRSSPAVIEFVNLIFHRPGDVPSDMANDYLLEKFQPHDTHHKKLWGRAELLPLVRRQREAGGKTGQAWRNPLEQPRQTDEDMRHFQEGELIAGKIRKLLGTPVADGSTVRRLTGDDVMILLRDRTHARFYEDALRRAGIPYIGTGRGAFRQSLEVRDLLHLLHHLIEPYNDLALASALRSPLFAASEDDLLRLAQNPPGSWHERLLRLPPDESPDNALARARRLLPRWSNFAVSLPVHDLLDRIYCEGNVVGRYLAAAVPHLKPRIETNLNRLLDVALDIDSGRYPSLSHFLSYLEGLSDSDDKTPSQPAWNREPRVRVMTIHGAKGLEAPVVFLADAARSSGYRDRGMQPLIDWPVNESRPRYFHLGGNSS